MIKMYSTVSYMSVLVLLVVDVRTGALQQQEPRTRECHVCLPVNNTSCEQPSEWSTVTCPVERPYCATVASAPSYRSSLTCSALLKSPCSLSYTSQNVLSLNCICTEHICNVPFSSELRNKLFNFSSNNNTSANLTKSFFKMIFVNFTDVSLYKRITMKTSESIERIMENSSQLTPLLSVPTVSGNIDSISRYSELHPHAEALKEETTALSDDDDDDDSEGSGSYQEAKSHIPQASAPAAPSSFLPAKGNGGVIFSFNFSLKIYVFMYFIVM